MQIKREQLDPTNIKLTVTAEPAELVATKEVVLKRLARQMKIPGFRPGKAPLAMVERNADSSVLQTEFLDEALNRLYQAALDEAKLRPVAQPKVTLQKFVPFTHLEVAFEAEVVGDVTLPDYRKFKLPKTPAEVTGEDADEVIESLRVRLAEKQDVGRPAKKTDEVTIDFAGIDAKTKEPVKGAAGQAYPLVLGSDTFIPGFEDNVIGLAAGDTKTFDLVFPKDYGLKALQSRKVTFTVTVNKVQEVVKPKVDAAFAAKVGPFKTLAELKADIEKQLASEKQLEADRAYESKLLEKLTEGTTVAIPAVLIDQEVERTEQQARQNLAYRGQTWQEYLNDQAATEAEYRASLRDPAEKKVRAGLALSEVAEKEGITVTPEEFQIRLQLLKGQYTDKAMQDELEKVENARQIISAMLTEKTIARLTEYATKS